VVHFHTVIVALGFFGNPPCLGGLMKQLKQQSLLEMIKPKPAQHFQISRVTSEGFNSVFLSLKKSNDIQKPPGHLISFLSHTSST